MFCFPLDHTRWNNSKCTEAANAAVSDISGSLCFIAGVKFWQKDTLVTLSEVTDQLSEGETDISGQVNSKALRLQRNLSKS